MNTSIYFDNAATTPLDIEVKKAMIEALGIYGNPSSSHAIGRKSKALIETARADISGLFNCQPSEIFFTSGGTESDNLAVMGVAESGEIDTIISSPLEHPAILASVKKAASKFNIAVKWVDISTKGDIDIDHLTKLLSDNSRSLVA